MTANNGTLYDYECSGGLLLPIINEFTWAVEVRAFLYLVGLLYCFMGIAIIADIFMCSIEKITSKTRTVFLTTTQESEPETIEIRIWSDTVANLTLMALGSSAPEILLSCIEIIGRGFQAGELGPGTIVGSAAFNLFGIVAVCVACVPTGEVRTLKYIKVFAVTAFFSFLAYVWLLVILVGISPGVVDIWEAAVTLGFFPLMVLLAWLAERNFFLGPDPQSPDKQMELGALQPADKFARDMKYFKDGQLDKNALVAFVREVKKMNPKISDEDAAVLAAQKLIDSQPHSRMWYRIGATRDLTGSRKTQPAINDKLKQDEDLAGRTAGVGNLNQAAGHWAMFGPPRGPHPCFNLEKNDLVKWRSGNINRYFEVYTTLNEHPEAPNLGEMTIIEPSSNAIMEFHAATAHVMENIGKFDVSVIRTGVTDTEVSCRIETIDGTATEVDDYVAVNEVITFKPGQTEKLVSIEIVNDNQWEPDEEFFLKLSLLSEDENVEGVEVGRISIMEITILNDDEPGILQFRKRGILVNETVGVVSIAVLRKNGADGEVSVKWRTIDKSALNGKDYEGGEGVLYFKHTETERTIEIPIINDYCAEKNEHFEIELCEPTGGALVGRINRTAVTIISDDNFNSTMQRMMSLTNANLHAIQVQKHTWGEQIREAMTVNGGDVENASTMDYVMHFFTFGWKILFALVPPSGMLGGWPCFVVSISLIGMLTAVVGDLASIFGCLVGLKDSVTAITLVALGTSLPDTFASRTATVKEKYADFAIGNITGSNSVNVFLGLGLPWLMAAAYRASLGEQFVVPPGSLVFSVVIYCICAVVCVLFLLVRRYVKLFGPGELGGPTVAKYVSAGLILCLWFIYLLLSILQAYDVITGF